MFVLSKKGKAMTTKLFFSKSALLITVAILIASCEKKDISTALVNPSSIQYLIFGVEGGLCFKCSVFYKLDSGQLYTTGYAQQIDAANPQFVLLSAPKYDSVSHLISQIPASLLQETAEY